MSKSIQPADRTLIKSALGANVDIFAATAVKLYCTAGIRADRWIAQGHEGALILLKDRALNSLFFRLVCITRALPKVVWEHEVYFDFDYRVDCAFFHSFDSDQGQQIGFLFANEREAADFARLVLQKIEILQVSLSPTNAGSMVGSSRPESIKSFGTSASGNSSSTTNRFFTSLFSGAGSGKSAGQPKPKKASEITANDIGDPTDFRHLAHIGFNVNTGAFDVQNIPAEWKEIFKKAGVTKAQLENRETAGFIAKFVKSNGTAAISGSDQADAEDVGSSRTKNTASPAKKGPPPPPPAKTIKAALPPPVRSRTAPTAANPSTKSTAAAASHEAPTFTPIAASVPKSTRIERDEDKDDISPRPPAPALDPSRAELLASIRSAGAAVLKPVQPSNSPPPMPASSADQTDIMASMLAKALAERNRKMAHSDSENGEDSDW